MTDNQPVTHEETEILHEEPLQLTVTFAFGDTAAKPAGRTTPTHSASDSRYQVVSQYAAGGLGVVSIADDLELNRRVAFKQIRPDYAASPDSCRRFLMEAEITGKLEHPGVVPVYGLVTDAAGNPAYAMRFIQGETFGEANKKFHAENNVAKKTPAEAFSSVSFRRLLARFVSVCNTIAYAHNRGIIHRDIKPENLMLGKFGEISVLDWGLARPINEPENENIGETENGHPNDVFRASSNSTQLGLAVGTPAFMSPEQADGRWDVIGPAADVYSLGATLYTLLTNRAPVSGNSAKEVLQRVKQGQVTPVRELNRNIPKPLAAICRKAMQPNATDRYASALELAEDIDQYLADEPVSAYTENMVEKTQRFSRKHRTLVAAVAASLLIGVLGLGLATALLSAANDRERTARETAEAEAKRADENLNRATRAVNLNLTLVADNPVLKRGDFHDLRRELLGNALVFFQEFSEQNANDPKRRSDVANAYRRLGLIQAEMGERHVAVRKYQQAVKIQQALADEFPEDPTHLHSLSYYCRDLGVLLHEIGDFAAAEKTFARSAEIFARISVEAPHLTSIDELALVYNSRALLLGDMGELQKAEKAHTKSIELLTRLVKQYPTVTGHQRKLADCLNNLANFHFAQGNLKESTQALKTAIRIYQQLLAKDPDNPELKRLLASSLSNSANQLRDSGQLKESLRAVRQAIEILTKLVARFPQAPEYRQRLGVSYATQAFTYDALGEHESSLQAATNELEICRELAIRYPSVPSYRFDLAKSHGNVANPHKNLGNNAEAEVAYRKEVEVLESLIEDYPAAPDYRVELAGVLSNLGNLLYSQNKSDEAIELITKSVQLLEIEQKKNPDSAVIAQYLRNGYWGSGRLFYFRGEFEKAVTQWDGAIELSGDNAPATLYIQRLFSLAHVDAARAIKESHDLANDHPNEPSFVYITAMIYSIALTNVEDEPQRREFETQGLKHLQRAIKGGFRSEYNIRNDVELAALRELPAFEDLMRKHFGSK